MSCIGRKRSTRTTSNPPSQIVRSVVRRVYFARSAASHPTAVYRNDAGHPTGKTLSRADADVHLRLFVRYASKLYALKKHFEASQTCNSPPDVG
jgi:hypothetical protein